MPAFQSYEIVDRPLPIISRGPAFVARNGLCLTRNGPEADSYYSGYPVGAELTRLALGQAVKRGVQLSAGKKPHLQFHSPYSSGYYHFLIEAVPRLLSLRERWGDYRLIIPDTVPNPWFADWLVEISGGNYVKLSRGGVFVRNVHFQQCPSRINQLNASAVRLLADYFRSRFGESDRRFRRLYISRELARHRRVANEEEVASTLERRGFVRLFLEELSFPEQVRAFAEAEAVVSIHGAGLANIVFMQSGSRVLELVQRPDSRLTYAQMRRTHLLNPIFRGLAQIKNLRYDALAGEPDFASTPKDLPKGREMANADLRIDAASLDRKVDQLLGD